MAELRTEAEAEKSRHQAAGFSLLVLRFCSLACPDDPAQEIDVLRRNEHFTPGTSGQQQRKALRVAIERRSVKDAVLARFDHDPVSQRDGEFVGHDQLITMPVARQY